VLSLCAVIKRTFGWCGASDNLSARVMPEKVLVC